ncbi:hypothetical protein ACJX0J_012814, partial [Zea mays]
PTKSIWFGTAHHQALQLIVHIILFYADLHISKKFELKIAHLYVIQKPHSFVFLFIFLSASLNLASYHWSVTQHFLMMLTYVGDSGDQLEMIFNNMAAADYHM